MADNVAITAGSGTSISTDDCGAAGHAQVMKLAISTDGSATLIPADATSGLDVDVTRIQDITASGSITTRNLVPAGIATANSTVASAAFTGLSTLTFQVTGTYTGAGIIAQGTLDGAVWVTIPFIRDLLAGTMVVNVPGATAGIYSANCAGMTQVRVGADSAVTGTAVITMRISASPSLVTLHQQLPAGSNVIGGVTVAALAAGVASIAKAEDVGSLDADVGVGCMAVRKATPANTSGSDADYEFLQMSAGRLWVSGDSQSGDVAHGTANSGNPVQVGLETIAHGTNPTQVAAGSRTKLYANRHGIPFVMGGHPNIVTVKHTTITTAVTDSPVITVSAGTKIVVTSFMFTLDNASTVFPTVLLGFGTASTPTTTGVIGAHGGVPAGGGFGRGDGSGILGIGADNEDLRVTTTGNATGNGLQLVVTYYTIES